MKPAFETFVEPVIDGHIVLAEVRNLQRLVRCSFELDQYGIVRSAVFEKGSPKMSEVELATLRLIKSFAVTGQFSLTELSARYDVLTESVAGRLLADAVNSLRQTGRIAA